MAHLKIAVVLGSTREGRNGAAVAEWILAKAAGRDGADYELVDLRDHPLPVFDEPISPAFKPSDNPEVQAFSQRIAAFDGYVFVTPEYNHGYSAVLKNAIDSLYTEFNDKAAAFASYGSFAGARAVEQLRLVASELQLAHVRQQLGFNLFTDFEDFHVFKPGPQHEQNAEALFSQLEAWAGALKSVRERELVAA